MGHEQSSPKGEGSFGGLYSVAGNVYRFLSSKVGMAILGLILGMILASFKGYVSNQVAEAKEARLRKEAEDREARLKKENELADRLGFYRLMRANLEASYDAFVNQIDVRDRLVEHLERRLGPLPKKEFELLFQELHPKFDEEEKRLCQILRGITKNALYKRNTAVLKLLDDHPQYYSELTTWRALREHLELWLSKYEELMPREDTCLIYVGVEENKPFPQSIDEEIAKKISQLELERNKVKLNATP
jgi:hypothetical protein